MSFIKFATNLFVLTVIFIFGGAVLVRAQNEDGAEQKDSMLTGGNFAITKTVIAGGGAESNQQTIALQATSGQAAAGTLLSGGQFSLYTGFWTPESFAPTAARVSVGGRVLSAQGRGIRNVQVRIAFPSGEERTTLSGINGNYRFADVEVGGACVISISGKRFTFSTPVQVLTINEARDDINFVADN